MIWIRNLFNPVSHHLFSLHLYIWCFLFNNSLSWDKVFLTLLHTSCYLTLCFRPGKDGAPRFSLLSGTNWFRVQDLNMQHVYYHSQNINMMFNINWQLSALLWPTNHPWQPDMRHHLHPAQWPHQDWLRSAPSRAFYVTTTIAENLCYIRLCISGFIYLISAVLLHRQNL